MIVIQWPGVSITPIVGPRVAGTVPLKKTSSIEVQRNDQGAGKAAIPAMVKKRAEGGCSIKTMSKGHPRPAQSALRTTA